MKVEESLSEQKQELHALIDKTQDQDVLDEVRAILQGSSGDWYDELSDEQKAALDRSIAQADAGQVHSHEEVVNELEAWLKE